MKKLISIFTVLIVIFSFSNFSNVKEIKNVKDEPIKNNIKTMTEYEYGQLIKQIADKYNVIGQIKTSTLKKQNDDFIVMTLTEKEYDNLVLKINKDMQRIAKSQRENIKSFEKRTGKKFENVKWKKSIKPDNWNDLVNSPNIAPRY